MSSLLSEMPPNPRLQRTRAAVPLQSVGRESSSLGGVWRAPLSRKLLGDAALTRAHPDCMRGAG